MYNMVRECWKNLFPCSVLVLTGFASWNVCIYEHLRYDITRLWFSLFRRSQHSSIFLTVFPHFTIIRWIWDWILAISRPLFFYINILSIGQLRPYALGMVSKWVLFSWLLEGRAISKNKTSQPPTRSPQMACKCSHYCLLPFNET